jgi:TonB family protein
MAEETQVRRWSGPSRRRFQRFRLYASLDVTALRSGIPDTLPGRSVNVCERGIAAMLAGELVPGETVGVEVRLPQVADSLRTRAMVRYQDKLRCGLEFVGLSAEQRALIRDWAKEAKPEIEFVVTPAPAFEKERSGSAFEKEKSGSGPGRGKPFGGGPDKPEKKRFGLAWLIVLALATIGTGVLWWHWNRSWEELESGLQSEQTAVAEKPQVQVSAEVMEKLLIHRVEPTYPAEARRANLQGIVALDIVVGRDGSVVSMRPLNGPDILARAAMDALRWWKFEPYRVNGEPAVVETTVAVEFKR